MYQACDMLMLSPLRTLRVTSNSAPVLSQSERLRLSLSQLWAGQFSALEDGRGEGPATCATPSFEQFVCIFGLPANEPAEYITFLHRVFPSRNPVSMSPVVPVILQCNVTFLSHKCSQQIHGGMYSHRCPCRRTSAVQCISQHEVQPPSLRWRSIYFY